MENAHRKEPTKATANDTLTWQRSLPIFPPSEGWALTYALRGPASVDFSATPSEGGEYLVTGQAPDLPGEYFLQGYISKGSQRTTIYTGTLAIAPDLSTQTGVYDGRSANKKILDAIDAVIAGRSTRADQEYEIDFGGTRRRLKSISLEELAKVRGLYAGKVWRENNQGQFCPSVSVHFGGRW